MRFGYIVILQQLCLRWPIKLEIRSCEIVYCVYMSVVALVED